MITIKTKFLSIDEPTNHLDIRSELQIMDLVKSLGITVIAALHDLNIAANYCNKLFVIDNGKIVAAGTPEKVLNTELIFQVFGVKSEVLSHSVSGKPHKIYLSAKPRDYKNVAV